MTIHLTKKLAEKLKLSPRAEAETDGLLSWRAHYVQEHGYRFVVFMNDESRFTIVLNEAKAAKLKKLSELFIITLRDALLSLCVNPEVIDRYIAELGRISYSKNSDRKKTAQLNKTIDTVWWGLRDLTDDMELSLYTSGVFCSLTNPNDLIRPKDVMLELLARYGLPVCKCRAFDLNIRLDLDGRDAVRRLRVPAVLSFERLHKLLQTAFGWRDCHLYSFGLFEDWSDDYYATPDVELILIVDDYETNPNAVSVTGQKLSDYAPKYRKILYRYDFGDDWRHYIEIEDIIEDCYDSLPLLLSGERDAPPENAGGSRGFAEFLEIIANPAHDEYEQTTMWAKSLGWKPFDFEFVAKRINNNQKRIASITADRVALPDEIVMVNDRSTHELFRPALEYMKTHPNQWGFVIGGEPFSVCDNCGNPARVVIDDNKAREIGKLCDDCYNRVMAELTGSSMPYNVPKQISVKGKTGKAVEFEIEFLIFITGKSLVATEIGKRKRRADVYGELGDDFDVLFETLIQRIKKTLSVKYMAKDGCIAGDKAIGYVDYNCERGDCDIIIDGNPYSWAELEKNVSMREGWKIKIEFASDGDELD